MARGTRAGALVAALAFAVCVAGAPSPAHAQTADKCRKELSKKSQKFVNKRLKKVQKCANKAVKKNTGAGADCLANSTPFKRIKDKKCSAEALAEAKFTNQPCSEVSSACTGTVVDAATLTECMQCALTHSTNCAVATTYNLSGPQTAGCFTPEGGVSAQRLAEFLR
jgi:hypothetical protein